MGVVASFASVPGDVWPAVLPRVRAAGVEVECGQLERGIWWYACVRGRSCVQLGYCPEDHGREVVIYSTDLRFLRSPLSMWRLFRDVRRAVLAVGGKRAEPGITRPGPPH